MPIDENLPKKIQELDRELELKKDQPEDLKEILEKIVQVSKRYDLRIQQVLQGVDSQGINYSRLGFAIDGLQERLEKQNHKDLGFYLISLNDLEKSLIPREIIEKVSKILLEDIQREYISGFSLDKNEYPLQNLTEKLLDYKEIFTFDKKYSLPKKFQRIYKGALAINSIAKVWLMQRDQEYFGREDDEIEKIDTLEEIALADGIDPESAFNQTEKDQEFNSFFKNLHKILKEEDSNLLEMLPKLYSLKFCNLSINQLRNILREGNQIALGIELLKIAVKSRLSKVIVKQLHFLNEIIASSSNQKMKKHLGDAARYEYQMAIEEALEIDNKYLLETLERTIQKDTIIAEGLQELKAKLRAKIESLKK